MQLVSVVAGVVLDQWINPFAFDDVAIDDIVLDFVAVVHDERQIHYQTGEVAALVGAFWMVGRNSVVSPEFILIKPINDNSATGAFRVGCKIHPTAHRIEFLIVQGVGIDGEVDDARRVVGILHGLFASRSEDGDGEG